MPHVETASPAERILAKVPGLRARVEEMLTGILETALALRQMGSDLDVNAGNHLRVRVADHMISYRLDLGRDTATVVFAERLHEVGPGGGSSHAA